MVSLSDIETLSFKSAPAEKCSPAPIIDSSLIFLFLLISDRTLCSFLIRLTDKALTGGYI